ncbi:MAG: hypothetical protein RLZZ584_349 [Pseudomonadota bacterium]|jgi:flagellar protein FlgJ
MRTTGTLAAPGLPDGRQTLAAGGQSLDALRGAATRDPKGVVKEAARQLEALFMQELMKSMRATTMSSGLMDNNATEMAGGMLDQQYSQQLTGLPGGLTDAITRQLERQLGVAPGGTAPGATGATRLTGSASSGRGGAMPARQPAPASPGVVAPPAHPAGTGARTVPRSPVAQAAAPVASAAGAAGAAAPSPTQRAQDFLRDHRAAADAVARDSGIPADFMLAQAAHETGWGKREIRNADGSSANNLFGIKATGDWTGPVAVATTTEVIDGVAHKVQARFRAYATPEASFRDYAALISNSPRYAGVLEAGSDAKAFAQGLQRAGYATDPDYAGKLGRVINTTLRLGRLGA